jgi:OmpR family response regulator RpaB
MLKSYQGLTCKVFVRCAQTVLMHNWGYDRIRTQGGEPGARMLYTMNDIETIQQNRSTQSKVLVIDDDEAMIEMLRLVLDPGNYEMHVASSAQQGIQAARQLSPDLIILDLMIPEMEGWKVCQEMREFSQSPILVLSAISKPGIVARALDEGADDYLLKPITSSVLSAHIKRLARRARAEREAKGSNLNFLTL